MEKSGHSQLALDINLNNSNTFANFLAASNQELIYTLKQSINARDDAFSFIWSDIDNGKTHLLQACCKYATEVGVTNVYLPLKKIHICPELFHGLENLDLIVVDDIHMLAGDKELEQNFFYLFNYIKDKKNSLIISANSSPSGLDIMLPDLKSRLSNGVTYKLKSLPDNDKIKALRLRAYASGFDLPDNVAEFLINRLGRGMHKLMEVLNTLDETSLAQQRKLTIPFVKQVLKI